MLEKKLSELVQVNGQFQNSINLQLDLNKTDKVNSYIPTNSSVSILNHYLGNVNYNRSEKSTLLIGPYGKGKSHLLLVLLSIISSGYNKEECQLIDELTRKIVLVDEQTAKNIEDIREKRMHFLPVIVSNTQMDLNQAFLIALNEALTRENLTGLKPKTYFTEAVSVINNWEQNYTATYDLFVEKLLSKKVKVTKFLHLLEQCDKGALDLFSEIYPQLTAGSVFNPLINTEVLTLYKQINQELSEHGYSGMFIVFDEFSKFIEGHDRETIAKDFKVIQDICELANDSQGSQMHALFVVHKSLKEYNNILPKEVINAFRGIEGRLNEVLFNTSSQNNYELIQNAIMKKPAYEQLLQSKDYDWNDMCNEWLLPAYHTLFTKSDFENIIVKGCFPLTPVTSYLLLRICEIVAQNERTLFTFISKDEPLSMARYIKQHKAGESYFVYAEYIYDYFKNSFRGEYTNPYVQNEWLKAESLLKRHTDEKEQRYIKALAIITIVNRFDEMAPNNDYIGRASGLCEGEVQQTYEKLRKAGVIDIRTSTGNIYIKNRESADFEKELRKGITQLPTDINYVDILEQLGHFQYIQPKIHNQKFCMKRYFEYMFYSYENFLSLSESRVMFENSFSDGKIIVLFTTNSIDKEACKKQIASLADQRLLFIIPEKPFSNVKRLKEYYVLQQIKKSVEKDKEKSSLLEEIQLYEEEVVGELSRALDAIYSPSSKKSNIYYYNKSVVKLDVSSEKDLNRAVSTICDEYYTLTPKINNEMINKNHVSSQIKTARHNLLHKLIQHEDLENYYMSTSPDGSIFRSTLLYTGVGFSGVMLDLGIEGVLKEVKLFIRQADGEKVCFKTLYDTLCSAPYGMRKGAIPIYLSFLLCSLQDTPIIYLNKKEVPFDANIMSNINENPQDYYLFVEKGTSEKVDYLDKLYGLFERYIKANDTGNKISVVTSGMQRWMQSLPNIATNFEYTDTCGMSEVQFLALKQLRTILKRLECNPRELIFDKIPGMFSNESYTNCLEHIVTIKEQTDTYLSKVKESAVKITKFIFSKNDDENLNTILTAWYNTQSEAAKSTLISSQVTEMMSYIAKLNTYDEKEIVNRLSKIVLDLHIENWSTGMIEEYQKQLNNLKQEVECTRDEENISEKRKIVFTDSTGNLVEKYYENNMEDSTSYFLKNELNNVLDEFGESLEINQKVSILVQIINELVK